jgi:hypothetical protein
MNQGLQIGLTLITIGTIMMWIYFFNEIRIYKKKVKKTTTSLLL